MKMSLVTISATQSLDWTILKDRYEWAILGKHDVAYLWMFSGSYFSDTRWDIAEWFRNRIGQKIDM